MSSDGQPPSDRQLRPSSARRRPGRYQEDYGPVTADRPAFVHPDVQFNASLVPYCAFPSLPLDYPGDGPSEIERRRQQQAAREAAAARAAMGEDSDDEGASSGSGDEDQEANGRDSDSDGDDSNKSDAGHFSPNLHSPSSDDFLQLLSAEAEQAEARRRRPPPEMVRDELFVRMDPPPNTINPERFKHGGRVRPGWHWSRLPPALSKGLHPENYVTVAKSGRRFSVLDTRPWAERQALEDLGMAVDTDLIVATAHCEVPEELGLLSREEVARLNARPAAATETAVAGFYTSTRPHSPLQAHDDGLEEVAWYEGWDGEGP